MKQSCRDLEPLLTPYVDGEATADQCAAVEAHLTACRTCRDCADALGHVRQLVHDCREQLLDHAPSDLREKCARLARTVGAAQDGARTDGPFMSTGVASAPPVSQPPFWQRWAAPLSVAATLVLAVIGIFVYSLIGPRGTAFASQLAADHVRCTRIYGAQTPADPVVQAAAWQRARGWTVTLPASSRPDGMEFVLLRRCINADGSVAHALYRHQGRVVSLFIAQKGGQRPEVLEIMGQQTCLWNQGEYSYAVVADESPEEMARLVAWFRRRIGD
jgi:anti-sigma factor RsiW